MEKIVCRKFNEEFLRELVYQVEWYLDLVDLIREEEVWTHMKGKVQK